MHFFSRLESRMDLTTKSLGLWLHSPLVPSASPLSERIDNIRAIERAGAAAVVFPQTGKSTAISECAEK